MEIWTAQDRNLRSTPMWFWPQPRTVISAGWAIDHPCQGSPQDTQVKPLHDTIRVSELCLSNQMFHVIFPPKIGSQFLHCACCYVPICHSCWVLQRVFNTRYSSEGSLLKERLWELLVTEAGCNLCPSSTTKSWKQFRDSAEWSSPESQSTYSEFIRSKA